MLIGCSLLFSSCNILKGKTERSVDSTAVVKKDSGQVKVNTTTKTDSLAWWREIVNFRRDTTIIQLGDNLYPTSYIREGGTHTIREKEFVYDSTWKKVADSLAYKLSTSDKTKEVKTPGFWLVYVALGLCLLLIASRFLTIKK